MNAYTLTEYYLVFVIESKIHYDYKSKETFSEEYKSSQKSLQGGTNLDY